MSLWENHRDSDTYRTGMKLWGEVRTNYAYRLNVAHWLFGN